jgi:hypothetical protein
VRHPVHPPAVMGHERQADVLTRVQGGLLA